MIEFKLPSLGADMDEGKLVQWKVKPGDAVKKGDVVAVVDTSKAAIDVEIWDEGTVYELALEPGETVPVGTVIARLLAPGESAESAAADKRKHADSAVPPPRPAFGAAAAPPSPAAEARVRISPAARSRAQTLGVDIAAIAGSGPGGAILLEDVAPGVVGKGELRGTTWSVRTEGARTLRRGERVRVVRVDGLTLWV